MARSFSSEELLDAAREARARAYAPYSKFSVGAAVDVGDGVIFTGANVENAAYPLSTCAERVAITQAISAGYRTLAAVAVAGPPEVWTAPCGGCRQIIAEFGSAAMVVFTGPDGVRALSIEELLPASFGPAVLKK
ncbi:MAG: cytidine deaminase [Candidatus Eremiobacteraeota bacterium]|nr:cytidine deaminase [Candidatus Eremiobacteraeota bacterium]